MNPDEVTVNLAAAELGLTPSGVRHRLTHGLMRGRLVRAGEQTWWMIPRAEVERWKALGRLSSGRRWQRPPPEADA